MLSLTLFTVFFFATLTPAIPRPPSKHSLSKLQPELVEVKYGTIQNGDTVYIECTGTACNGGRAARTGGSTSPNGTSINGFPQYLQMDGGCDNIDGVAIGQITPTNAVWRLVLADSPTSSDCIRFDSRVYITLRDAPNQNLICSFSGFPFALRHPSDPTASGRCISYDIDAVLFTRYVPVALTVGPRATPHQDSYGFWNTYGSPFVMYPDAMSTGYREDQRARFLMHLVGSDTSSLPAPPSFPSCSPGYTYLGNGCTPDSSICMGAPNMILTANRDACQTCNAALGGIYRQTAATCGNTPPVTSIPGCAFTDTSGRLWDLSFLSSSQGTATTDSYGVNYIVSLCQNTNPPISQCPSGYMGFQYAGTQCYALGQASQMTHSFLANPYSASGVPAHRFVYSQGTYDPCCGNRQAQIDVYPCSSTNGLTYVNESPTLHYNFQWFTTGGCS